MDHSNHDETMQSMFMPHGHCYLWQPDLVATHVISDFLIGTAYFIISLTLYALIKKIKVPFSAVVVCFGIFIGACGLTHFVEIWTLWYPDYWMAGLVKVVTAIASVGTGIYLYKLRHKIFEFAELARLSEKRRIDLELLTKTLETRVAERTAELERALKLRDDFLSIASHEFRTPIAALKMQFQVARRQIKKGDASLFTPTGLTSVLDVCERQTGQLIKLIEDMLDVSRIRTGQLTLENRAFDLSELVSRIATAFEKQFEATGGGFSSAIAPGIELIGDPSKIEQVVSNVLSNALKYGNAKPVTIKLSKTDSDAIIEVGDQGIGISEEDMARIFLPFERAVSFMNISGLGLGLHISKQIVEAHSGEITLKSAAGSGTTFTIRLPLAPRS